MRREEPILTHQPLAHRLRWFILALYTASGFAALIYQILWTRYFKLVFGNTSLAVTTVVCTFMAGLALGSYWFGKRVDGNPRPLRLYGVMEIGIGAYALIFPFLFEILASVYPRLTLSPDSFLTSSLLRFLLSSALLIVPTSLMGGTFPVICKFCLQNARHRGAWAGRLYALNTLGGVVGVIAGGLLFPVWFGISASLMMAGLLNLLVGALSIILSRRIEGADIQPAIQDTLYAAPSRHLRLISWALLLSGLTALSYEILWVRILGIILGSSIYGFTLILATYLTGIALGSHLYARWFGRRQVNLFLFAFLQFSVGFLALLTLPAVNELPYWVTRFINPLNFSFLATQLLHSSLVGFIILLATLMMGATIPCAIQIVSSQTRELGYEVGILYGFNTVGAIVGSFATGFLLIPFLGIKSSFLLMGVVNVGIGLAVLLLKESNSRQRLLYASSTGLFAVLLLFIPPLSERALATGMFLNPTRFNNYLYNREVFEHFRALDKILFYRDGLSVTVAVLEGPGNRYLNVNGKTDGSTGTFDMSTQSLLAYIPLMLHPDPQEVLIIGLGTGVTAGAALDFPVRSVTQVEIEGAVVEAARLFEAENRNALDNPKLDLVVEDGRNYLMAHPAKFDAIISEPSNPWMSGVANLFTQEHFLLLKDRLLAGGVVSQWLQLYSMRPEDFRMVVRTFHSVFPEAHIFQTSPGDILLLGSQSEPSFDAERISRLFHEHAPLMTRLDEIQLGDPLALLEWAHRLDSGGVVSFIGEATTLHTDDRPYLELSAPRTLHESYFRGLLHEFLMLTPVSRVEGYFSDPLARGTHYLNTARISRFHNDPARGTLYFDKALELIPEDPAVQLQLAEQEFQQYRVESAIRRVEDLVRKHPRNREIAFNLARLYLGQGHWEKVEELLEQLLNGTDEAALWGRLRLAEAQSLPREKLRWLEEAYKLAPTSTETLLALAQFHKAQGDLPEEDVYLEQLLSADPNHYNAYVRRGELALAEENFQGAYANLLMAIAIHPGDPYSHLLLAQVYAALERPQWARLEYRRSLSLR